MEPNALDILIRLDTKVDVLNERTDRHENKNDQRFKDVFSILSKVQKEIANVQLESTREDGKIREKLVMTSGELKAKIAGLSMGVSILMAGLIEWIKTLFHQGAK